MDYYQATNDSTWIEECEHDRLGKSARIGKSGVTSNANRELEPKMQMTAS